MAATKLPHTLGAPTSKYKIKCTPGSVIIGDQEFLSATEALEAYLTQYDKQGLFSSRPLYRKTVTDLLDPKSALHMTAERSLETGVRATGTELRLADQKEKINESLRKMKKSVALKAEGNLDSDIVTPKSSQKGFKNSGVHYVSRKNFIDWNSAVCMGDLPLTLYK